MIKKERQEAILKIIRERKYCTVNYLSKQLFVAPITVRRDLTEMETAGLVARCFGGATIPEHENREVPFEIRNKSNTSIKEKLAKKGIQTDHQW
jgi:DeoR/GlpR family transcriptional regulator of sugar metabolism